MGEKQWCYGWALSYLRDISEDRVLTICTVSWTCYIIIKQKLGMFISLCFSGNKNIRKSLVSPWVLTFQGFTVLPCEMQGQTLVQKKTILGNSFQCFSLNIIGVFLGVDTYIEWHSPSLVRGSQVPECWVSPPRHVWGCWVASIPSFAQSFWVGMLTCTQIWRWTFLLSSFNQTNSHKLENCLKISLHNHQCYW